MPDRRAIAARIVDWLARDSDEHAVFVRHTNVEFGEVRIYSRAEKMVAEILAVSTIRLPFDVLILCLAVLLGLFVGGRL